MAANKLLLHDLLREDQEPFMLNSYISDKQYQLKQQLNGHRDISHQLVMQRKKNQIPVLTKPNISITQICNKKCFFSFGTSPDYKKSPLFQFNSPLKQSGNKSSNPVFLHIPARTASVLQEAASRIQKHSSSHPKLSRNNLQNNNNNNNNKSSNFGFLNSLLKKLTTKNRAQNHSNNVSLRWESDKVEEKLTALIEKKCDVGFCSRSCNCSLTSSVCWSESNEGKFLDNETLSSSCNCDDFDEISMFESDEKRVNGGDFVAGSCYEGEFCKSPFHFVLERSLEDEDSCGTPDFSSTPVTSPTRISTEEKRGAKCQAVEETETEDEEKEQFSPVSVLDPLFDIDEEENDDDDDGDDRKDENSFNIECSYPSVQKAKQQLLHKLRRFEQLTELGPIELEKRILEDEQEEEYHHRKSCDESNNAAREDMKKLVADLIAEEEQKRLETTFCDDGEEIAKRVFRRLETFKNEESTNTIDMMVEFDFKAEEAEGWKMSHSNNKHGGEQVKTMVMEIELAIFGLMVEELSEDLLHC